MAISGLKAKVYRNRPREVRATLEAQEAGAYEVVAADNAGHEVVLVSGGLSAAQADAGLARFASIVVLFDLRDAAEPARRDFDHDGHSRWWGRDVPQVPGREYRVFVRRGTDEGPSVRREYTQAMLDAGKVGRIRVRVTSAVAPQSVEEEA